MGGALEVSMSRPGDDLADLAGAVRALAEEAGLRGARGAGAPC